MALPMESAPFRDLVLVLGAAGLVIPAFAALRISPVVGFILVGVLAGPQGLGQVPGLNWLALKNPAALAAPAELGVSLLLFALGLELSLERVRTMRSLIFGLGAAQLLLCAGLVGAAALLLGVAALPALVLGFALALSSTAVALHLLASSGRMGSQAGRTALGVLLFQDIALVPLLLLVAVSGEPAHFGRTLALGLGALAGIALFAWGVGPTLFLQAARTRRTELFLAASLVVLIGSASAAAAVGLSPAVGALVAGLMLSTSDYRRQIEAAIQPFEGLLLGVFLIWVGSGLDLAALAAQPWLLLGGTLALLLVKGGAVYGLLRRRGQRPGVAGHVALLLAAPSETGLVVLGAAVAAGLLAGPLAQTGLAIASLGLALAPLLGLAGARLELRASPPMAAEPPPLAGQVVIIGYGRVGRLVAQMLDMHNQPWVAVDSDPDDVQRLSRAGKPVIYGDARRPELLDRLKLGDARAVVLTLDAMHLIDQLIRRIRDRHPDLTLVVRARDADHAGQLYRLGVTDAVPETVESSLQLAEAVLVDLGVPMGPVIASIHEKRDELRGQIKGAGPAPKRPPLRTLRRPRADG